MQQHTVLLTFDEHGNVVPLSEDGTKVNPNLQVKKDDQIRWTSPHGTVGIEFQDSSPFPVAPQKSDEFRSVSASSGKFPYTCTITTQDNQSHGWKGDCGGVVIVGGSTRGGN